MRDIERATRARHPDALSEIEPDAQRETGSSRFRFALDEGLADESKGAPSSGCSIRTCRSGRAWRRRCP